MKKTLISALALVSLMAIASPAFAACEAFYQERDVDRPVASFVNASNTGPVLNGADYTDWATIAETTPLTVTTGGTYTVIMGVYDVTDPDKPYDITSHASNNGTNFTDTRTDPDTICNN